jgi:hypothetical protein
MKKFVLSAITLLSLGLLTGCVAPVDATDEVDPVVGEAQQALNTTLSCTLNFPSFLHDAAVVKNQYTYDITAAVIHWTVHHSDGSQNFGGTSGTVNLNAGKTITFDASADPNELYASTCTAYASWSP